MQYTVFSYFFKKVQVFYFSLCASQNAQKHALLFIVVVYKVSMAQRIQICIGLLSIYDFTLI